MNPFNPADLKPLASKYIWWKTPDEAVAMPEHVIAQVMNIGDYGDVQSLVSLVGDEVLREVLRHAQAGQFPDGQCNFPHPWPPQIPPGRTAGL